MSMKIAAIIAEYNPFHNGHMYHIARTREAGYDRIVCIMDGHLTQRGRFAHLSKWDRAKAALMCGADAVIELPSLLACRSADVFARSGVALAHAIGAYALSFGSESDDISLLKQMAALEEDERFRSILSEGLSRGESQPRARSRAMAEVLGSDEIPTGPNATLATEYLRALNAIGDGAPEPVVIRRNQDYHSLETGPMASASGIRAAAERGEMDMAGEGLPAAAMFQLSELTNRHEPDDMYLHALRSLGAEGIKRLPDVSEGLENRMFATAKDASSLDEILSNAKCKRYTHARLMRLATHALTGLTAELAKAHPAPEYIRILGMTSDAGELISEISHRARLPMFSLSEMRDNPIFQFENTVTDLWALTRNTAEQRRMGQEYTTKFIKVQK